MGFLANLMASPEQKTESYLEATYTRIFQQMMGVTRAEARTVFKDMLSLINDTIAQHGDFVVSEKYGRYLLANRHSDPSIRAHLTKIEADGVRTSDIIWFWDMSNVERLFIMKTFELCVGALWCSSCRQGMTPEQAGAETRKAHPFFGNSDDTSIASGNDRPIPVELKDRIALFIDRSVKEDSQKYFAHMERSSSFNALIRQAIKDGRL